jgi:hypothetical protein
MWTSLEIDRKPSYTQWHIVPTKHKIHLDSGDDRAFEGDDGRFCGVRDTRDEEDGLQILDLLKDHHHVNVLLPQRSVTYGHTLSNGHCVLCDGLAP